MRALILVAGAALALAACDSDEDVTERYPNNQVVDENYVDRPLPPCRPSAGEKCPDQP